MIRRNTCPTITFTRKELADEEQWEQIGENRGYLDLWKERRE